MRRAPFSPLTLVGLAASVLAALGALGAPAMALEANEPALQWFPSFGPMQFAAGGAFGGTALWGHLALGLLWAAAFSAVGLAVFWIRTRSRNRAR